MAKVSTKRRRIPSPAKAPAARQAQRPLALLGVILLVVAALWLGISIRDGSLAGIGRTWIPPFPAPGAPMWMDHVHTHLAVNHLAGGGNPYREQFNDPNGITYAYPPLMLALFAWLAGMDIVAGALAWTIASLAMLLAASWMSARSRRELGLYPLPWTLVAGAVVLSTPMLFMLERGNTDIIVVAAIALAALALKQRGWGNDLLVALCIAVAAWTKVYPAMLVAALLPLRRTRAAVLSIAIIAAVGVLPWEWTLDWIHSARTGVAVNQLAPPSVFTHSIAGHWGHLAEALDLHAAAAVPGLVVAALVLVPLAAWVSWPISWKHSEPLAYPYLLWFAQVWTFALPSSYFDYKLIFMPLAMLAVWSPRDRLPIQLLFAPFLLYWQPVALPLASTALLPWVLLAIKVAALVAIGLMIRARTRELPAREA